MKQCRLSNYNQVIETFETGFYDECDNEQLQSEIMDCPDNVEPLMWYINGQWLNHEDYQIPIVQKFDDTVDGLTVDQLIDLFKWQGVI